MQLNKYQAILISKLVSEYLKDASNDFTLESGLMCQLEDDLGRYIIEANATFEVLPVDTSIAIKI
ncbi:MAG: hypothetical protein P8P29_04210 [Flavobacteriaceae bacterium]|nr:hypothetical protein [Flavobacteriaceae bacterium]